MKNKIALLAVIMPLLACSAPPSQAWPAVPGIYGTGGAPPTGPVLNNVSVPFGLATQQDYGAVRLNSQDITQYSTTFHPNGLGLVSLSGTSCATYTLTFLSGRSSTDFTIPAANTAEGVTALTPRPSATGFNNLSGDYSWHVTCKDVSNNSSNTVTLTYTGVAKAASAGTYDATDSAGSAGVPTSFFNFFNASGFAGTTGWQVLFSVGMDRSAADTAFTTPVFSNKVAFRFADAARPGAMVDFENTTTAGKLDLSNLWFTGDAANALPFQVQGVIDLNGGSDFTIDNAHGRFAQAFTGNGTIGMAFLHLKNGASIGTLSHSDCLWCVSGLGDDGPPGNIAVFYDNWTFSDDYFRYWSNNCVALATLQNSVFQDFHCPSPMSSASHLDAFQILDGYTPQNITLRRFTVHQADGNANAQGPIFPGGNLGHFFGYIDDGTGAHSAGKKLTVTSTVTDIALPGAYYWGPSGPTTTSGVYAQQLLSGSGGAGSVLLMNIPGGNTVIGSPGSPAEFYGLVANNWIFDNVSYDGFSTNGAWAVNGAFGTLGSLSNSNFLLNFPPWYYQTTFTGSITGCPSCVLHVTAPVVGYQGILEQGEMNLYYTGCLTGNGCTGINLYLGGGVQGGAGNYSLLGNPGNQSSIAMFATGDQYNGGPNIHLNSYDVPSLYSGTFPMSGVVGSGLFFGFKVTPPDCSIPVSAQPLCGSPPGGVTFTHNFYANYNTSTLATYFALGDPNATMPAFTQAAWAALDDAGIEAQACKFETPKTSGPLDLGAGAWSGYYLGGADAGKINNAAKTPVSGC